MSSRVQPQPYLSLLCLLFVSYVSGSEDHGPSSEQYWSAQPVVRGESAQGSKHSCGESGVFLLFGRAWGGGQKRLRCRDKGALETAAKGEDE